MGFREEYGELLQAIAQEADAIAMRYFRADELRVERKGDGTAVTQADRAVEEMARAKVAASGLALDVLGEEMGGGDAKSASASGRARMIIDPIDGTEEFSRGIQTFGTLMGIESNGEIDAALDWTSKPWDLAPLGIMVEEAGGRSTNVRGERTIYSGQLISTNGKIHDEVLAILR